MSEQYTDKDNFTVGVTRTYNAGGKSVDEIEKSIVKDVQEILLSWISSGKPPGEFRVEFSTRE